MRAKYITAALEIFAIAFALFAISSGSVLIGWGVKQEDTDVTPGIYPIQFFWGLLTCASMLQVAKLSGECNGQLWSILKGGGSVLLAYIFSNIVFLLLTLISIAKWNLVESESVLFETILMTLAFCLILYGIIRFGNAGSVPIVGDWITITSTLVFGIIGIYFLVRFENGIMSIDGIKSIGIYFVGFTIYYILRTHVNRIKVILQGLVK